MVWRDKLWCVEKTIRSCVTAVKYRAGEGGRGNASPVLGLGETPPGIRVQFGLDLPSAIGAAAISEGRSGSKTSASGWLVSEAGGERWGK